MFFGIARDIPEPVPDTVARDIPEPVPDMENSVKGTYPSLDKAELEKAAWKGHTQCRTKSWTRICYRS